MELEPEGLSFALGEFRFVFCCVSVQRRVWGLARLLPAALATAVLLSWQ